MKRLLFYLVLVIASIGALLVSGFATAGSSVSPDVPPVLPLTPSLTDTIQTPSRADRCPGIAFDTEAGSIEVVDGYVDEVLPLCLDDEALSDWSMLVEVRGGYEPQNSWIYVSQKSECAGAIWVAWTLVREGDCGATWWQAAFTVREPIALDSNQYPEVFGDCWVEAQYDTIPGKEVWIWFSSVWSGCELEEQEFLINVHGGL